MAIDKIFDNASVDGIADNLFNSVSNSVSEIKAMQQRKAAENVQLVIEALKKIDADIREKYDGVTTVIEKRVATIKDGRDGINGKDGRDGKDGRNGRDGATGPRGMDGARGLDGVDGEDGVSVTDAHIDFDGSLIISLSSGRQINVGEVVAPDLAEKIKVITNGGGTSQGVLDTLTSLQNQIDLISTALVYKGTWNASTNTPTLATGVGTANTFYIVSVAGSTTLDGISNWGVGDWVAFNGTAWQRIEGGAAGNFTDVSASGSVTLSGGTSNGVTYLNGSNVLTSGSVLTFNGTALGVIGTTSTSTRKLTVGTNYTWPSTTFAVIDFGLGSVYEQNGADVNLSSNVRYSSIFQPVYKGALGASKYTQYNGAHTWDTAATGTAGANITFTTAMTLTAAGRLGIATTSPTSDLSIGDDSTTASRQISLHGPTSGTNAGSSINVRNGTNTIFAVGNASNIIGGSYSSDGMIFWGNAALRFYGNSAERMRLDSSGNLGIGTSSPSARLEVSGSAAQNFIVNSTSTSSYMQFANSGGVTGYIGSAGAINSAGGTNALGLRSQNEMAFATGGATERMRIDSSGNLGLGVTPSAWSTSGITTKVLEMYNGGANGSLAGFSDGSFQLSTNAYYGASAWAYKTTDAAANYLQQTGKHVWRNAASGTAGAALTWTTRMTLDASGNLGLGVTPSAWGSSFKSLDLPYGSLMGAATSINMPANAYHNGTSWTYRSTAAASNYQQGAGAHSWYTVGSGTAGTAITFTQAMTLNSSGQLGVGTTSPDSQLTVNGASSSRINMRAADTRYATLYADSGVFAVASITAIPLVFGINDVEKARIDSSGNFMVGVTGLTSGMPSGTGMYVEANQGNIKLRAGGGNTVAQFAHSGATTVVGSITVTASATSYVTSSDYRLKNNIAPMTGALAKVALLKPCTYKWNVDGSDGQGFIAHELAEVVPQCVTGEKDGVNEDGTPKYQGIDTSFLVATLTAAIQELKAEFDAYKASHP